ncbi:MAG: hypothetical protein WCG62_04660, partial [Actinomycetes bacterium]
FITALWLGIAHIVGAITRGVGQSARDINPDHRKDGLGLGFLGSAVIVGAVVWFHTTGLLAGVVTAVVVGGLGIFSYVAPIGLTAIAIQILRHPDAPKQRKGRLTVGWTLFSLTAMGLTHLYRHNPSPASGSTAMRNAAGWVGWIFTARVPVKGSVRPAPVKKLAIVLPDGKKPTIGTTLTPKAAKAAPKATKSVPTKGAKKAEVAEPAVKTAAKKAAVKTAAKKAATSSPAAKRDRAPVNSEELFSTFLTRFKLRSHLEGTVVGFTSHGAIIEVTMDGQLVQCYAPTTSLGEPAPARARDVLKRGSSHKFRFSGVDKDRRIAELSLVAP